MEASDRPKAYNKDFRDFFFPGDLVSGKPSFITADYHHAKRHIANSNQGFFQFSMERTNAFKRYDTRSARLGSVLFKLVSVDSRADYHIRNTLDPDVVLLHLILCGSAEFRLGQRRQEVSPGQIVLLETNDKSSKRWRAPTQLVIVRISRRVLLKVAREEFDLKGDAEIELGGLRVIDPEHTPTLWNFILMICRDLGAEKPALDSPAGGLTERALYLLLLNAISDSFAAPRPDEAKSTSAPYYIRRVEQHIHQFAREFITMDDLVEVSGVSARSIYSGFRKFRATTPMSYLKSVRLDLARSTLLRRSGEGPVSVTEAALSAGYTNMSQFSRDYRLKFREPPSKTLRSK